MSTAMATAAVEPTTTMEATTTVAVEATAASRYPAACVTAPIRSASTFCVSAATIALVSDVAPSHVASSAITAVMAPTFAAIVAMSPTSTPVAVIPRAGANKHSARKPVRAVESVRRAGIWVIVVVPVFTHRRAGNVARTNADSYRAEAHPYSDLRLRIRQRHHHQYTQQH